MKDRKSLHLELKKEEARIHLALREIGYFPDTIYLSPSSGVCLKLEARHWTVDDDELFKRRFPCISDKSPGIMLG
jgi:hypothetical protein